MRHENKSMIAGVIKESKQGEARVALTPKAAEKGLKTFKEIWVEAGAGAASGYSDEEYLTMGCQIKSRDELLKGAGFILAFNPMDDADLSKVTEGSHVLGMYQPYQDATVKDQIAKYPISVYSMDMLPRITIAQSMDVLSSMASVAGYYAVVYSSTLLPRYFPMLISAAGTIAPAKVLILGAGVAGLQAIATARRLGAQVEAFDTRAASKEEVESLGAKFVEVEGAIDQKDAGGYAVEQTPEFLARQRALVQEKASKADVVICTAQIRGKKAPVLITADTVKQMRHGSVIIDMAASTGGNCELTQNDKTVKENGVTIVGNSNLANFMAADASTLYSNNLLNYLKLFFDKEGNFNANLENEIIKSTKI